MEFDKIRKLFRDITPVFVSDMLELSAIPSVNPKCGGSGEYARCKWIAAALAKMGYDYEWVEVPDSAVREGVRVNIIVRIEGCDSSKNTLWFMSHTDTVSPGDLSLWDTDPFTPVVKGDMIYGLGVEDNSQAVITFLEILKIMKEQGIKPRANIGFLFVCDEECGSDFGLKALIERGYIASNDEAIVPDYGSINGDFIEIAEKSTGFVKFTVTGIQGHASMPHKCRNAYSAANHFAVLLEDSLKSKYTERDELFDPPYSTFEPTQTFSNVASPNVIPGSHVFFMDMRILPTIPVSDIISETDSLIASFEAAERDIKITAEYHLNEAPSQTPSDSAVARTLMASIKASGVSNASFGGIGGGTCAAILRRAGIPAAVWSTLIELAHQPNEHIIIDDLIKDASVFLSVILSY